MSIPHTPLESPDVLIPYDNRVCPEQSCRSTRTKRIKHLIDMLRFIPYYDKRVQWFQRAAPHALNREIIPYLARLYRVNYVTYQSFILDDEVYEVYATLLDGTLSVLRSNHTRGVEVMEYYFYRNNTLFISIRITLNPIGSESLRFDSISLFQYKPYEMNENFMADALIRSVAITTDWPMYRPYATNLGTMQDVARADFISASEQYGMPGDPELILGWLTHTHRRGAYSFMDMMDSDALLSTTSVSVNRVRTISQAGYELPQPSAGYFINMDEVHGPKYWSLDWYIKWVNSPTVTQ